MTSLPKRQVAIMGIRGVPAHHGGFETFAERLGPHLVRQGWEVTIYCQEQTAPGTLTEDRWEGVRRVHIGAGDDTALNSMRFDWACIRHAVQARTPVVLTLGYNTALFGLRLRRPGMCHVVNMDGIEWARQKWGPAAKAWLYLNDWAGCLGAHHLLADHPQIARHLMSRRVGPGKISTIPYGTDLITQADSAPVQALGLEPGNYATLIARPEPENSVLEIVKAFSAKRRGIQLAVLGTYYPQQVAYHAQVQAAASPEVRFLGGIYDHVQVNALRFHGLMYLHGHRVGGTNPSLVEAMGAGNPVIAQDNRFNRWVAREGAWYFRDVTECTQALDRLLADAPQRQRMSRHNLDRARMAFNWPVVLSKYELTLAALHARATGLDQAADLPFTHAVDSVNMDLS